VFCIVTEVIKMKEMFQIASAGNSNDYILFCHHWVLSCISPCEIGCIWLFPSEDGCRI